MADLISLAVALAISLARARRGPWRLELRRSPTSFLPAERAVANWRLEAARRLDIDLATSLTFATSGEPKGVTRCVRLNNYWCIKGVGWTGMVAADAEGHVAFASALEGATVAALLLRRYYLDYSRRSAKAIISRWPAQCGYVAPRVATAPPRPSGKSNPPGVAQHRRRVAPPSTRVSPASRPTASAPPCAPATSRLGARLCDPDAAWCVRPSAFHPFPTACRN